jgi:glycosyltransferase involved in cell wall biosynthesis
VLFAQRLTQQKGLDYLAALVIALSTTPQFEHIRFTIAGSNGDYEGLARELAERFPNVTYRGFVSDMVGLYAEHDVAIVPSRWEMFPYSVLEPQAAGLPVIAFDIPGPQDIIVDGVTGWLVPPGKIDRLQEVVREIIDRHRHDPDTLQTMRRYSRDLALARFKRERVLQQVVSLLATVAGYPCGGAPS